MISVVVPCYNCEKTLDNTVQHLFRQTKEEFQIVLVDDGSTDSTPTLCDRYASSDDRIKVIHQENKGLMGAWKAGVTASDADFIGFCDADDYIDSDFIETIDPVVSDNRFDIIVFEMLLEYNNGETVAHRNKLKPGIYDKEKIDKDILPYIFSTGEMESYVIDHSRCSKVFRKKLLTDIFPYLNEDVSIGEDSLTTFLAILNASCLICMENYQPYHYIRNTESMIGGYDAEAFDKLDLLYGELDRIADLFGYGYKDQIMADRLSETLLFVKKEICKNPYGYKNTISRISRVRNSQAMCDCIRNHSVESYSLISKLFANLWINKHYWLLCSATKIAEKIRGRNV